MNLDAILRRAADFQRLTDPKDVLSRLVDQVRQESELSEDELDHVAAAAAQPPEMPDFEKGEKEK